MPRLRANSLTITIVPAVWRAARPPTPRRSTFPGAHRCSAGSGADDIPPVPPLSYFEPDTPELVSSPALSSPGGPFSTASQSSGGLSPYFYAYTRVFQYPGSPLSPVHLFSCIPSCEASPLSPRFLFPRTPPLPPQRGAQHLGGTENACEAQTAFWFGGRRHSTPYAASTLALCGSSHEGEAPRKLGWAHLDSPATLHVKKGNAEKEREAAIRQRHSQVLGDGAMG